MESQKYELSESESVLNISQKLPETIEKLQPQLHREPIFVTFQEDNNKTIFEKNNSLKCQTIRKKNYAQTSKKANLQSIKTKKDNEKVKIKHSQTLKKLKITQNTRKSASKMVANFRRRKQYSIMKNLSEFHYKIIGDIAVNIEEKEKETKNEYKTLHHKQNLLILIELIKLDKSLKKLTKFARKAHLTIKRIIPTFNPNTPLIVAWDFIVMILTFFRIIFYSIEKGFVTQLALEQLGSLLFFVLLIDIGIKLNTKIFLDGIQITERGLILRKFMRRNIFTDVLPCLALCILYFSSSYMIFNEINLLLFGKLMKASEVAERIKGIIIKSDKAESAYNLVILILKIFIMAHSLACLWHYIGYNCNILFPNESNWLKVESITNEIWVIKYIYSIYWAITTMLTVGYGDITPTNNPERLFNILAMLVGCGMFGYTMNSIGEIIKFADRKNGIMKEKMNKVSLMMKGKSLPLETQTKVRKYLEFVWKQDQKEDPEHENYIMSKLSSKLRDEIFFHTHVKYLKSVPAFKSFSDKTLVELASHMKRVRFSPEEFVYREGEHEEFCLYFVLEGRLSLVSERPLKSAITWRNYKKDDYFGVEEFFTGKARCSGMVSLDFSSLFQISRRDLINVLQNIPNEYEIFCQIKDLELLYNEHSQYETPCASCKFNDHRVNNCKYLKYEPVKLMLIGKYNSKKKIFAKKFKRKGSRTNALIDKNNVSSSYDDFLHIYNEDEDFNDLKTLYLELYKDVITHSNESIDVSESEEEPKMQSSRLENQSRILRSLKSIRRPTLIHKNTRRFTNFLPLDLPSQKFDKAKGHRESNIFKSLTSIQNAVKEKPSQPQNNMQLNMDKMKSYLYYFTNNNVENIIFRINSKPAKVF